MMFTAEEKYQELMRELKLRRRLYPHWIVMGKLDEAEAKRRIETLEEIAQEYAQQAQGERLL